jgi:Kef-type K+ transport system membrane component KefB
MTFETNGLLLFGGLLLLLGHTGAALAARTRRVPGITGMLIVGFIAGPSVLGLVDAAMLAEARVFVDVALGLALIHAARRLVPSGSDAVPLVVAFLLLALGVAKALSLSPLLGLLAMGLAVRNLDHQDHLREVQFGRGGELFFLILFVFAGANLHVEHLVHALVPALVFVAARFTAKTVAVATVTRLHGFTVQQGTLTGFALLPMAGMAIGLVQSAEALYPAFVVPLSALVLGAVAILETLGPVATEFVLKQVGEVDAGAAVRH